MKSDLVHTCKLHHNIIETHKQEGSLTIGVGAGLCVTGAVLDPLALTILAPVFGQRVVAGTEGILHSSTAGPRAVAPGTPHPPSSVDRSLKASGTEPLHFNFGLFGAVFVSRSGPHLVFCCFALSQTLSSQAVAVVPAWGAISPGEVLGLAHQ